MILSGIQSYFPLGLCTTDIPRGFQPNFPPGNCYKDIPRGTGTVFTRGMVIRNIKGGNRNDFPPVFYSICTPLRFQ